MEQKEKKHQENQIEARLVTAIAKRYLESGIAIEELENYGRDGLEEARRKYDPNSKFRFIAWAVWFIRQSIVKNIEIKKVGMK